MPTAVTVFLALLNGVINPFALPSIITSLVATLSIVDCASCVPLASLSVIVCPAAGVVPDNPLYLILVLPSPLRPAVPSSISIPLSAKYVKQFSHSTLAPLVTFSPLAFGVINVTLWNNIDASRESTCATLPSKYAPRPASPAANPLGSVLEVVVPFVITLTFLM